MGPVREGLVKVGRKGLGPGDGLGGWGWDREKVRLC